MNKFKIIVTNSISGKKKVIDITSSASYTFNKGDEVVIGTSQFPHSINLKDVLIIKKGPNLEISLSDKEDNLIVLEDYFTYGTGTDILILTDANEATYLSLSNGELLTTLSDNTVMSADLNASTKITSDNFYGDLEDSWEWLDSTTLYTAGAVVAAGAGYAIFGGSDDNSNSNSGSTPPFVLPPKEIDSKLMTNFSLTSQDADEKVISTSANKQDINTLTPTLQMKANEDLNEGDTIVIKIEKEVKAKAADSKSLTYEAKVNKDGSWSFTIPKDVLSSDDKGNFILSVKNANGVESKPYTQKFVIDTTKPEKFEAPIVSNGSENGDINTLKPTIKGSKAEPGARVKIVDNSKTEHWATVDDEGDWSFTFPSDLKLSIGTKYDFTATIYDQAGNEGKSYTIPIKYDNTPPVAPKVNNDASDDVGSYQGVLKDGDWTDDTKPKFRGTGEVGAEVILFVDGVKQYTKDPIKVSSSGTWEYQLESALKGGYRRIEFKLKDPAGNESQYSTSFYLNVDDSVLIKESLTSITFTIDNKEILIGSTIEGNSLSNKKHTFTGYAPNNIGEVAIYKLNGDKYELITKQKVTTSKWSVDVPYDKFTDGQNAFKIVPISKAGNTLNTEKGNDFVINYEKAVEAQTVEDLVDNYSETLVFDNFDSIELQNTSRSISSDSHELVAEIDFSSLSIDDLLYTGEELVFESNDIRSEIVTASHYSAIEFNYIDISVPAIKMDDDLFLLQQNLY